MSGYNDLIKNAAKISQKPIEGNAYNKRPEKSQVEQGSSFNSVLKDKLSEINSLQFSKHAAVRLSTRAISLSEDQLKRVESGILDAGQKGIKDSLVLVDDLALLVNVPSKTVITAINQTNKNIFTNIDGAVIV
ncbi:MAG: hypothetical protein FWE24_05185 [Defluviitaleaceae bacterium]|nr:hypothetical protein [Defluviitaleaceae bacterium]